MYTIQTNVSGTRSMEISEEHLKTIQKYALFQQLIDSNGIVDESVLDKLKLNVRSLIASMTENCKDLLDLCIDVIYHNNMIIIQHSDLKALPPQLWSRQWIKCFLKLKHSTAA